MGGGTEQRRPSGNVAVADGLDPATLFQGLDDVRVDRHAADILDVAAGDRLAVGDDRQGFQHRTRIARRFLVLQARQPGLHLRPGLEAPAVGHLHQFDAAALPLLAQLLERAAQHVGRQFLLEHALQLGQRKRLVRRQQGRLEHGSQIVQIVIRLKIHAISRRWGRRLRPGRPRAGSPWSIPAPRGR